MDFLLQIGVNTGSHVCYHLAVLDVMEAALDVLRSGDAKGWRLGPRDRGGRENDDAAGVGHGPGTARSWKTRVSVACMCIMAREQTEIRWGKQSKWVDIKHGRGKSRGEGEYAVALVLT